MFFLAPYNKEAFRKIKGAWKQRYFEKTGFSFTCYVNWRNVCKLSSSTVCDGSPYPPASPIHEPSYSPVFPAWDAPTSNCG